MGKALGWVGGGFLALLLVFAALTGLSDGEGLNATRGLLDAAQGGYGLATARFGAIDTGRLAGNGLASAVVALAAFAAAVVLIPSVRGSSRGLSLALGLCLALGFVLYVSPGS